MQIRRANVADIPSLNKLLRQVLDVHFKGRSDLFKENAKKYTDDELKQLLADPNTPVFVAERCGVVEGYAFCIFKQEKNSHILTPVKTLYIDDLCVDEACRGKGVGKLLYHYVVDFAKQQGCYNVTLNVWACNQDALAFYQKLGLKPQKIAMEKIL